VKTTPHNIEMYVQLYICTLKIREEVYSVYPYLTFEVNTVVSINSRDLILTLLLRQDNEVLQLFVIKNSKVK
jgi:hypothetical protein